MNIGINVIGAILVAICASPIIYFIASRKNQEKKLINALKTFATQHHETIGNYEICGQFIVGVNDHLSTLYFAKQHENKLVVEKLLLKEVAGAVVETKYRTDKHSKSIEHLGIRFLPKRGQVSEFYWDFYNIQNNFQLNGELQLADSWVKRINQIIV